MGNLPSDGLAVCPGDSNTLRNRDTLGDSNTVRNCHTLGDSSALRNSNTVGDADTLGNSHAVRNFDALGDSDTSGNCNGAGALDRDLLALSFNLLLTLRSNSNWGSNSNRSNRGSSKSNWCWASGKRGNWKGVESKELSISIGISVSFSISFTLAKMVGKKLRSSRNNTSRESSSIDSKSRREKARSSNSSGKSIDNSRSSNCGRKSVDDRGSSNSMSNNISVGLDMNLGLSADLVNNVFAFLNKSCLRDCLSLSGALLLSCALLSLSALLLSGTLLGISALLLGGTRLFSGTLLGVSALLLGGTLGHVSALFLSGGGALLVGDIPHNVGAGLLSVSCALLLRNLTGSGGTLWDTSGGAFLLVFCSEVGDSSCVAFRICDCGTSLRSYCVIGDGTLWCIMFSVVVSTIATVTIARISLGITQGKWYQE